MIIKPTFCGSRLSTGKLLAIEDFTFTSELFSILENKLIDYSDDSTLIAVVPSPGLTVAVAESLSLALVKANEWCDLGG